MHEVDQDVVVMNLGNSQNFLMVFEGFEVF